MFKKINLLQLVLLSVSAIISLKTLPLFAEAGPSIIFFLVIATICFFIPISVVIAELSSAWPNSGGCYAWIKEAYGKKIAFCVMWAYWMESIIWFPTMLIFVTAMLAASLSPIFPNLENDSRFLISGIVIIFWILTYINFQGIKISTMFSTSGVLLGTIIPILIIIIFGFYWIYQGNYSYIKLNLKSVIPNINLGAMVFFSGTLLGLAGIEIISFYVNYIENPQKNIAKAVFISSFIILITYILGSLMVAMIVKKSDICLASGIIQSIKTFLEKFNISFLTPVIACLLLIGSLSGMNTWIIGPAQGLLVAADDGFLPKFLCKTNTNNIPTNILIVQATIGSLLSVAFFLYMKNVNGLVWLFVCLSFQFASLLYIMLFFSILKLRKIQPKTERPFKAPFVKLISYIGITMCIFTFFISYVQPDDIGENKNLYSILLIMSFIILMCPAIYICYKKN